MRRLQHRVTGPLSSTSGTRPALLYAENALDIEDQREVLDALVEHVLRHSTHNAEYPHLQL